MSLCSRSTAFQAALLISWCLTLQAGVAWWIWCCYVALPGWRGAEGATVFQCGRALSLRLLLEAGVHTWFPSPSTSQTFTEAGGITSWFSFGSVTEEEEGCGQEKHPS